MYRGRKGREGEREASESVRIRMNFMVLKIHNERENFFSHIIYRVMFYFLHNAY